MKKVLTLCLVQKNDHILLGMKKRGFGQGWWNGFGGKVQPGETLEDTARREMVEECGLLPSSLEKVGLLLFSFENTPDTLEVHVFSVEEWSGQLTETEEMKPQWFHTSEIPFDTMWPDDTFWFPLFLAGKKFRGSFLFDAKNQISKQELSEVLSF